MKTTSKIINGNLSEYDSNGEVIHFKTSTGFEYWYDSNGNKITKKEFDELNQSCDGKKYQLKLV